MDDVELIPCPRGGCGLDAELDLRPDDALMHSLCARGHDVSLAPEVLRHLRAKAAEARSGFVDRCGQPDPEGLDP